MRSPTSFCAVVALAGLACAAPRGAAQSWTGGIKSGVVAGSFTGKSEFTWKPVFSAVGVLTQRLGDRLSRQVELSLSQAYGVSRVGSSTLTFTANYVNVPVLLSLSAPWGSALRPFVMAGPNVAFRLRCNLDFTAPSLSSRTPCDNSSFSNRVDVGVAGGAGVAWQLRGTTLSLEGRGAFGFRSIVVPLDANGLRSWSWGVLLGASTPVHFGRRAPIGPVPPGFMLVPVSGGLPEALPSLPAAPIAAAPVAPAAGPTASVAESSRRITVTAHDADARSLLIAIAREAGISLVVSSDVRRRVSVSLTNASADEAIAAIIAQAGLSIARPAAAAPAVVYYQLAVNVNQAPAETIAVRFGVGSELAKWIVESRSPQTDRP